MSLKPDTAQKLDTVSTDLVNSYLAEKYTYSDADPHFQIFTTLRYDPKTYTGPLEIQQAIGQEPLDVSFFFLLQEHVDKLHRAGTFFNFPTENLTLGTLVHHLTIALKSENRLAAQRIKVCVSKAGEYSIEHAPLPASNNLLTAVPSYDQVQSQSVDSLPAYLSDWSGWLLYLDSKNTQPTPFTSFKTTERETYNESRARFNIVPGDRREVLLYDSNDRVMEGSITSVAFWRRLKDPISGQLVFKWVTPPLSMGCMDGVVRKWLLDDNKIVQGIVPIDNLIDGEYVLIMNGLMGVQLAKLVLNGI